MGANRPLVLAGLAVQALNLWLSRGRLSRLFTTPALAAAGFVLLSFTEAWNPAGEFFDGERVRRWLTAADGRDASRFTEVALRVLGRWR
jgi:hypothetical protein